MTRTDRIALRLAREVAVMLAADPEPVMRTALANVEKVHAHSRGSARHAVERWADMLAQRDVAALRRMLLEDSEDARMMRNSSVFAGIIPEPRRMQIVREVLDVE